MKKAFRIIEKTFVALAIIGLCFKLMLWKGGDFMLVISLSFLSLLYFPAGYFQPDATQTESRVANTSAATILLKILSGIAFSTLVIGLLFKLLFWKGGSVMLLAGLLTLAPILMWAVVSSKSFTAPAATAVFRRGAVIAVLGIAASLVSTSTLYQVFHRDDPQLVQKWIRMSENPDNPAYRVEFDAYRRQRYATPK